MEQVPLAEIQEGCLVHLKIARDAPCLLGFAT